MTGNGVCELREEVLRWARRLLPFSRFLNAEETLQDLVLSLVAELPAIPTVKNKNGTRATLYSFAVFSTYPSKHPVCVCFLYFPSFPGGRDISHSVS